MSVAKRCSRRNRELNESSAVWGPTIVGQVRRGGFRFFGGVGGCLPSEASVNACRIVVMLEAFELALQIDRVPEHRLIEVLAAYRSDGALDEWMRHRDKGNGLYLFDFENPQVCLPSM